VKGFVVRVEWAIDALPRLRSSADALGYMNASGSGAPAVPPMQKKTTRLHLKKSSRTPY